MNEIAAAPAGTPGRAGPVQGVLSMLAACLPMVALMALPPALPKLLAHFGKDPGAALLTPMIVAAPGACMALLAPMAGLLADRFGRRRVVLWALGLFTLSGAAPLVVDDLWLILASRLALGVANAALLTTGVTMIGDYFEGEARRRWLAVNGVAGSLMISLAMLAGGVLAEGSWRAPFLLNLVGVPVLVLALWRLFEPPAHAAPAAESAAAAEPFPWRALMALAGLTLLVSVLFYAEALQIGLVLDQAGLVSPGLIGVVGAAASTGYPLGAVLFSRLARRWRPRSMMVLGWNLMAVGLIGLGGFADHRAIGAAGFVQQVGGGVILTSLIHGCYERFPYRYRARGMGVWTAFFFAGQFASPLIVAALAAEVGGLRPAIAGLGLVPMLVAALTAVLGRTGALRPLATPA